MFKVSNKDTRTKDVSIINFEHVIASSNEYFTKTSSKTDFSWKILETNLYKEKISI